MTERITQKFALTAQDGIYTDSAVRGLRLRVRRDGKYRFWIFRRTVNHKNYEVHLGKPAETDIAEIRLEAVRLASLPNTEFLSLMAQRSSSAPRNDLKPNLNALFSQADSKNRTFEEISASYFSWLEHSGRVSFQTLKIFRSFVCRYVLPVIEQKYVTDITSSDIAKLAVEMNVGIPSRRVVLRQVRNIFNYAKARNILHGDNPADPKGPLQFLLPATNYIESHRGALSVEQLPHFFAVLMSQPRSMTRSCYIFAILTTVRAQTARSARWEQIDFEKKIWSIPETHIRFQTWKRT